jgi:hypothetical protein
MYMQIYMHTHILKLSRWVCIPVIHFFFFSAGDQIQGLHMLGKHYH